MTEHRLHVLAHTHWDREWYLPFQQFRFKLVGLLDELLPRLASDEGLPHFQLDGQVAVIDDYLEIRPEQHDTLRDLVSSGRLAIGPWYVLPDEFLVSGETHIRNLQRGIQRANDFGGAMPIGYLPDMFGHIAQLPQILAQFNMTNALVWRGVPSTMVASSFMWEALDGTAVRTEYLPGGYFNGADTPPTAEELQDRVTNFLAFNGNFVGNDVLWMAGMDHEVPAQHLETVMHDLNHLAHGPSYSAEITSLQAYLDIVGQGEDQDALQRIRGELRSSARSNLLMGTFSNRVDVKILAAQAERILERQAEPLIALWGPKTTEFNAFMDLAWTQLIVNSAHDSICACSHDDVVTAVNNRYLEAIHIGHSVIASVLEGVATEFSEPGTYIVNPTARNKDSGVLVTTLATNLDELPEGSYQIAATSPQVELLYTAPTENAAMLFARESMEVHSEATHMIVAPTSDSDGEVLAVRMYEDRSTAEADATPTAGVVDSLEAMGAIGLWCAEHPDGRVATWLHRREAHYEVLVHANPVPGFGWTRLEASVAHHPVSATDHSMSNGLVNIEVANDGTYSINGQDGYGRLVDQGDAGDSYNWSPPDHDVVVDTPVSSTVTMIERGPLRAKLQIDSVYELPTELEGSELEGFARSGSQLVPITTTLTLCADDPSVYVETTLDHQIRDHRLRVEFPLPNATDHSFAECAFGVVERPLTAESGPNEWGIPSFPSRRFVHAGGLTITHEGLCEYELLADDAHRTQPIGINGESAERADRLALTLVRATGWISRGPMTSRPMPAGPPVALPNAQLPRELTLTYALRVEAQSAEPSWTPEDGYGFADHTWNKPYVVQSDGGGTLPATGTKMSVGGAEVSALYRNNDGDITLRVHEANGAPSTLTVDCSGRITNLLGEDTGEFAGSYSLRPHEIVTITVSDE